MQYFTYANQKNYVLTNYFVLVPVYFFCLNKPNNKILAYCNLNIVVKSIFSFFGFDPSASNLITVPKWKRIIQEGIKLDLVKNQCELII